MEKFLSLCEELKNRKVLLFWILLLGVSYWATANKEPSLMDWMGWQHEHRIQFAQKYLASEGYLDTFRANGDEERLLISIVEATTNIINRNVRSWKNEGESNVKWVILDAYTNSAIKLGYTFD